MKLTSIKIKNFKNLKDSTINFDDTLTILIGNNGTGKSALLEAIAISLGTIFIAFDGLKGIPFKKTDARRQAYSLGESEDVQYQYPIQVSAKCKVDDKELSWSRSLNSDAGTTTIKDAKNIITYYKVIQEKIREGNKNIILPIIAFYRTGKLLDYHRERKNTIFKVSSRINGYIDSLDGTANVKVMINWFIKQTIKKYQNKDLGLNTSSSLDLVCSAMERCYQMITGKKDSKIAFNLDTKEILVYYKDNNNKNMKIPLSQMSDGYKTILSLIADIAYRMSVLNPQLKEKALKETDGIVLIDEIDLHLHPIWQQRILHDLQVIFPKVQFIVTTHSPTILQSIKNKNIRVFNNNGIITNASIPYGKDLNFIISQIMNAYERPIEILEKIKLFYTYMDTSQFNKAKYILDQLDKKIGDDPLLSSLRVQLNFSIL